MGGGGGIFFAAAVAVAVAAAAALFAGRAHAFQCRSEDGRYSLEALAKAVHEHANGSLSLTDGRHGYSFRYAPCATLADHCVADVPLAQLCQTKVADPSLRWELGLATNITFQPGAPDVDVAFTVVVGGSDHGDAFEQRMSAIDFICDPTEPVGLLIFVQEWPLRHYYFAVKSALVC